ncbi:MAG: hypothetical protein A2151_09590 [Candidatus Muproteobacteria bacterium RBG_16_65_34]|uniref:Uncharacterized protein n=1 Tax=Candidatus Muproteobacteria bacterium RBG_16_65_34 TaxID=1817760 RepID=A0A1F6TK23_9PROT|nr:MAG: hypothetical protein A2151_09590 [Candidatus Muproteobacteria bacterium RBG_16_65_34]
MEFLNFFREDPVMAWLVFLGLLVIIVPAASVLWGRMAGRNPVDTAKQPVGAAKPIRFGNQTELVILLLGLLLLLAVIGWIRSTFFE